MAKTHWRTMMDRDYLGSFDLPEGRDAIVTIARVTRGELMNGRKTKDHKPVVYFEGKDKALVCNATNGKTLQRLFGPYVEDWVGKRIALFVTTTSSPDGEVPCIRVRPTIPRGANQKATATEREPGADDVPTEDKGDEPLPGEMQ